MKALVAGLVVGSIDRRISRASRIRRELGEDHRADENSGDVVRGLVGCFAQGLDNRPEIRFFVGELGPGEVPPPEKCRGLELLEYLDEVIAGGRNPQRRKGDLNLMSTDK
jgi:hypothetical protein